MIPTWWRRITRPHTLRAEALLAFAEAWAATVAETKGVDQ